jgi:ABC-type multidrug transport system fused ATPase/permease subunit
MVFSAVKEAWNFVDKPLRKLFSILLGVRLVTNFFDLIGTALMAVLVGYVVSVLSGNPQTAGIQPVINFFNLEEVAIRNQVIILGVITLSVFVLKPIVVLPISRFLSLKIHRQGANLTNALITDFTRLPLSAIKKWSSPEVNYATTQGLPTVLSLLWTSVALISDVALILMFFIALFITNPVITIGLLIYVFLLFALLAWINGTRITDAGRQVGLTSSKSTKGIMELLSMFRELYVSNRLNFQVSTFKDNRISYGHAIATVEWLGQVPRFVIDSALVLGIVVVAVGQSNSDSVTTAATSTALFLTAALRILPTIAPIQGSINGIKNMKGMTERVHLFSRFVQKESAGRKEYLNTLIQNSIFSRTFKIQVNNLSFNYPESDKPAINNISFAINSGSTLAIIGSSGSGKTTLADCLLGLLEPTSGNIEIDKTAPEIYRTINSGSIAYVSQDVALVDGSIKENVAFALPESEVDAEKIGTALKRAHIYDFVKGLPQGVETVVGERGTRLSGGQRQRIGIARALYSNPKILVLDEATSALDAETESAITGMLKELHGQVTIISIAHRLSTVMHSDLVLFLRDGKLAGSGKFEDLVQQHPDLAHQAELLGIDVDAKENN